MYTSALFTALLAGSALALHPVQELVRRQTLTNDIIPAACQDTCSSSLPIYNACLSGDQTTCLTVCDEANFDPFVACFNCIIQNVPGGSSGQFQEAQQLIGELESACQQDGSSVGSASLSSASGASGASSAAAASFTSASSGITIGGGSSTGGLASITSSVAAGASSASQAVAGSSTPSASQSGASAASSSPNAGVSTVPTGIFAVILGAIGALAL